MTWRRVVIKIIASRLNDKPVKTAASFRSSTVKNRRILESIDFFGVSFKDRRTPQVYRSSNSKRIQWSFCLFKRFVNVLTSCRNRFSCPRCCYRTAFFLLRSVWLLFFVVVSIFPIIASMTASFWTLIAPRTSAFVGGTGTFIFQLKRTSSRSRIVPFERQSTPGKARQSVSLLSFKLPQYHSLRLPFSLVPKDRLSFCRWSRSIPFLQELRWRFPLPLKAKWSWLFFRRTSLVLVNLFRIRWTWITYFSILRMLQRLRFGSEVQWLTCCWTFWNCQIFKINISAASFAAIVVVI